MARISIVAPRLQVMLLVLAILGTYSKQRIMAAELVVPECPPFQVAGSVTTTQVPIIIVINRKIVFAGLKFFLLVYCQHPF